MLPSPLQCQSQTSCPFLNLLSFIDKQKLWSEPHLIDLGAVAVCVLRDTTTPDDDSFTGFVSPYASSSNRLLRKRSPPWDTTPSGAAANTHARANRAICAAVGSKTEGGNQAQSKAGMRA